MLNTASTGSNITPINNFALFSGAKNHIMHVHRGQKSKKEILPTHQCIHCGKNFSYKSTLTSHFKSVHKMVYDFECNHCGKTFWKADLLNSHVNTIHDSSKAYRCQKSKCGKTYNKEKLVREHYLRDHKSTGKKFMP